MSHASEPVRRPDSGRRRTTDRRGQSLTELVLVLPVLLVLAFGILELGHLLETQHTLSTLTREGANLASRGTSMELTLEATRDNQEASGLGPGGCVIVNRVLVNDDGQPRIARQKKSDDSCKSQVGAEEAVAEPYEDNEPPLLAGQTYYVVEIFLPYQSFTPLGELLDNLVPESLYDRSLF